MDLSKLKNNKAFQIAMIIALPTALVGAYYGYKYLKRKSDEKRLKNHVDEMQSKYEKINSINEFLEGIKYVDEKEQFGYNFDKLQQKRADLEKLPLDKLKRLYVLMQIPAEIKTKSQKEEFIKLIQPFYQSGEI